MLSNANANFITCLTIIWLNVFTAQSLAHVTIKQMLDDKVRDQSRASGPTSK